MKFLMQENCTSEVMQNYPALKIPLPLDWTTLLYTYIRYMYDYKCRKYVQFYVFVIYSIYIYTINMSSFNMSITPKDPNHKGIHICITTSSKILQLQFWRRIFPVSHTVLFTAVGKLSHPSLYTYEHCQNGVSQNFLFDSKILAAFGR